MKKRIIDTFNKLGSKAQTAIIALSIVAMTAPVNASTVKTFGSTSSIGTTLGKLLNLVFGFFAVMGVVQLGMGIYNWVSGAAGDQSDAQKVSKGQGEVIRGVVMIMAVAILNFIGLGPNDIIRTYFS